MNAGKKLSVPQKKRADAEKWFESGKIHFNEGRFEKAILDFNKAIDLNCTNKEYFFCRGNAHRKLGNFLAARRNYKKATAIDPSDFRAYTNWALTYFRAAEGFKVGSLMHNHFIMANKYYKKAIESFPNFATPYFNLGNIYYANGCDDVAMEYFDEAIKRDLNYASAYNNRGNVYLSLGKKDLALLDYNKAIEVDSFCMAAYTNRSKINLEKGLYKLALQDMPFITDEKLLSTIATEAKKYDNFLDIEALIKKTRKINFFITTYRLQLNEAQALLAANESTRTWLLQAWQQLATAKDIDDNEISINEAINLPAELWELISMFLVGLDKKGTYKIQDIVNRQLQYGFAERLFSSANNAGFFKTTPQTKGEIEKAESRYQRRKCF